jgi:hypothetical protein
MDQQTFKAFLYELGQQFPSMETILQTSDPGEGMSGVITIGTLLQLINDSPIIKKFIDFFSKVLPFFEE